MVANQKQIPFTNANYHYKMAFMRLTLDKAGRVVLPKPLRDEMHLEPGDELEIETSGEDITLRPLRVQAPLRKKQGVWVYGVGEPLSSTTVDKVVRQLRRERDVRNLGGDE